MEQTLIGHQFTDGIDKFKIATMSKFSYLKDQSIYRRIPVNKAKPTVKKLYTRDLTVGTLPGLRRGDFWWRKKYCFNCTGPRNRAALSASKTRCDFCCASSASTCGTSGKSEETIFTSLDENSRLWCNAFLLETKRTHIKRARALFGLAPTPFLLGGMIGHCLDTCR